MAKKPHKWGYIMFVLSGVSGFAYNSSRALLEQKLEFLIAQAPLMHRKPPVVSEWVSSFLTALALVTGP